MRQVRKGQVFFQAISKLSIGAGLLLAATCVQAAVSRDIDYLADAGYADGKDLLDVHMPEGARSAPVLVFFHGGALSFGNKSYGDGIAERLEPFGIGLVSANYRLSPGVQHPAHAEDAAAAFAWTVRHIAEYGGDPDRVFVAGHSAGAYLAALLSLDQGYLALHGLGLESIAGAILVSPFLYVEETASNRPKIVWGANPDDWLAASVSPHIGPGKSPMLLLYADGDDDWRKAQIERFALAMREAGNSEVGVFELGDRTHSSLITRINEASDRIGEKILAFLTNE